MILTIALPFILIDSIIRFNTANTIKEYINVIKSI